MTEFEEISFSNSTENNDTLPNFEVQSEFYWLTIWNLLKETQREVACLLPIIMPKTGIDLSKQENIFFVLEVTAQDIAVILDTFTALQKTGVIIQTNNRTYLHPEFKAFLMNGPLLGWES